MSMGKACEYRKKTDKPSAVELREMGWTLLAISVAHNTTQTTVRKMINRELGILPKAKPPCVEDKERSRVMYIQHVWEKKTFKSIGEEHGISGGRVRHVVDRINRRARHWWSKGYQNAKYPDGVLIDPDGIGEFEDEWTVEEQFKENALDVSFGYV
jgi:hypothetical protein